MKKQVFTLLLLLFVSYNQWGQSSEWFFAKADTLQSKVLWKCDKHNGSIKLQKGGFVLNNQAIVGGLFYINMSTIKDTDMSVKKFGTAVMILENTLKNEFFEVKEFPLASFKLLSVDKIQENNYKVTGDFTLHGITICLSFNATIIITDSSIKMTSETIKLDRTDWGIYRMSPKRPYSDDENNWTVPDEIEINLEIIANKNQENE